MPSDPTLINRGDIEDRAAVDHLLTAAAPMTSEQLNDFATRLDGGWTPMLPSRRGHTETPALAQISSAPRNEEPDEPEDPNDTLEASIYSWISNTLDTHVNCEPREHADRAVQEFLQPPCTREELLRFFRAFAAAYERMLYTRAEIPQSASEPTGASPPRMLISTASSFPDPTKKQLDRLASLERTLPAAADLFRLSEFAGCSTAELALYLDLSEDVVGVQLQNRQYDVYRSASNL
jgi:hypothetical protein